MIQSQSDDWAFSVLKTLLPRAVDGAVETWLHPHDLNALISELLDRHFESVSRMADMGDVVFGDDVSAYGEQISKVFRQWDDVGSGPSLVAMVAAAIDHFGIPHDHPVVPATIMAAVLAEYPNTLLYHGNDHYRKVLVHLIRLLATNQGVDDGKTVRFNDAQILNILIAACIHDLGHRGDDNMRNGIYTPGYLEQQSVDLARPFLMAVGLTDDDMADVETVVFCTDITISAGDHSPCLRMKRIFNYFFVGGVSDHEFGMMSVGKLRRFYDNPALAQMAMMLHEADIGSSAGVSYEQSRLETAAIMAEQGGRTAGPKNLLVFLTQQLDGQMSTAAAQSVFGPAMRDIIARANEDVESGIEKF